MEAYPGVVPYSDRNTRVLITPASMFLNYALEQPAAADVIKKAVKKIFADLASIGVLTKNDKGTLRTISAKEHKGTVKRSIQHFM